MFHGLFLFKRRLISLTIRPDGGKNRSIITIQIQPMRKFPFIRQHDGMQCGVACLAMICQYYGKNYSLEQLSKLCGVTPEGVSLKALADVAGDLGMETISTRLSECQLSNIPLPCILHWNQNHFVVLYKISSDAHYYLSDPAKGRYKVNGRDLAEHWISTKSQNQSKGIAFILQPTDDFGKVESMGGEKDPFVFCGGM